MAANERHAGRKRSLNEQQIQDVRQRFAEGETATALAKEYGLSRQTISSYLHPLDSVRRRYISFVKWSRLNREFQGDSVQDYALRMEYMDGERCCTVILVDFLRQRVRIHNTTDDILHRAFGVKAVPDWADFEAFMESRCVPRSRDRLRVVLDDLGVDSYDPLQIAEKTQGRMADDNQWIRFYYFDRREAGFA